MNKTISMSIRVSEEELEKLKQAARLESYMRRLLFRIPLALEKLFHITKAF